MTLTGRQIREARILLGLQRSELAARVNGVTTATIVRAEAVDDEPPITIAQAATIKRTLETAGVEFLTEDDGRASVRLRKSI